MSDWKELVGGLLVAGSQGYMAGKQEEWSQEAARAKSQAAMSLEKNKAKWAHQYEMKVEGFKQEGAERLETLKQTGSTERQKIESSGKVEESRLDALGKTKKATEAGVADQDPIDDKRSMEIIATRKEQLEEQVRRDLQGDEPGVLADWLPGGNSSEKYETAVQAELQKRMGKDSVIKKHRNLLGEGGTASESTERPVNFNDIVTSSQPVVAEETAPVVDNGTSSPVLASVDAIAPPQADVEVEEPGVISQVQQESAPLSQDELHSQQSKKVKELGGKLVNGIMSANSKQVTKEIATKVASESGLSAVVADKIRYSRSLGVLIDSYSEKIKSATTLKRRDIERAVKNMDMEKLKNILEGL